MRRLRYAAACAATASVLLGATACGGNPAPEPLPKSQGSPSASATPSPSATPPVMPAAAREKTKQGAVAFVRHYVSVLNYATFSGDTQGARRLDQGKCESCQSMLGSIDSIYKAGGEVQGGAWTPTPISDARFPDGRGWTVDAKISYGPQSVIRAKGKKAERFTGGSRLVSFILGYAGGKWRVTEWTRAS